MTRQIYQSSFILFVPFFLQAIMLFPLIALSLVICAIYSQPIDGFSFSRSQMKRQRLFISSTSLFATRSNRDYNQVLKVAQDAAYKAGDLMR